MNKAEKGTKWIEHHPTFGFLVGLGVTAIGFLISTVLFTEVSVAMLFLSTLLLVPLLGRVLKDEERIEKKTGLEHFWRNHRNVFELYVFVFLGIFVGYLLIGFTLPGQFNDVFMYQLDHLGNIAGLGPELIDSFLEKHLEPSLGQVSSLVGNNIMVMVVAFLLSLFYGAGAIFLIVLNASIFAAFLVYVVNYLNLPVMETVQTILIFNIHLLPEVTGFLVAAIGGGVLSQAILVEEWKTTGFRNVSKDALYMLMIALTLVIIGAFLEVYVTPQILQGVFL